MALKVEKTLSRTAAPAIFDSAPRYNKDEAMSELTKRFPDIVERMRRSLIEEGEDAGVPRIMRYRELKQLDCINLMSKDKIGKNVQFLDDYTARVSGQKVLPASMLLPFLKEGIIKYYEPGDRSDKRANHSDYTIVHFVLLDSDLEEETFTVRLNAYKRMRNNPSFTYEIGFTVRFHRNGLTISSRLTNDNLIYVAENCGILTSSEKAMVKPKGKTYTVKENAL